VAILLCVLVAPKLLANIWRVLLSGGLASVIFFIVSNSGVWWSAGLYPHTVAGYIDCLEMGLPFFRATLEGTVVFSVVLYGLYRLVFAPLRLEGFFTLNYGRSQR
jgi:hypothetical protein